MKERDRNDPSSTTPLRPAVVRARSSPATGDEQQFHAAMLDNIADSVIATDLQGRIIHWNKGAERIFGWTREEARELTPAVLYPEVGPEAFARDLEIILRDGEISTEWKGRHKDGRTIWVDVKTTPMRDAEGRVTGFVGVSKDISQRKRLEQSAARRSDQLRELAAAAVGIHRARHLQELVTEVTDAARRVIGTHLALTSIHEDQAWDRAVDAFSASDKYARYRQFQAKASGQGIYHEVCATNRPMRLTDGELKAHSAYGGFSGHAADHPPLRGWLAAPLVARDGRNLGLIQVSDRIDGNDFSADDESLLVQLAHLTVVAVENAQLISQLEEAVRIRDEFLSVASHELNTPITAATLKLQTMLKAFQRGTFNLENGPAQVEMTLRQVKRLSQHVAALLDVSRMHKGGMVLTRTEVDLSLLVEEVSEQFRELAAATGCPLKSEVQRGVVGSWDRVRLEQVVSNLVSNALKYGKGRPVDVRLFVQGDRAVLEVRDRGMGIAPADQVRVFEKFERAVPSMQIAGLGLGLFICRRIVDALGGELTLQSTVGEGSTFRMALPLQG